MAAKTCLCFGGGMSYYCIRRVDRDVWCQGQLIISYLVLGVYRRTRWGSECRDDDYDLKDKSQL